jgi:hypothetical protein
MLPRRIVWLLTVVIALGAASAAPMPRLGLTSDACAIVCIAAERSEHRQTLPSRRPPAEPASAPDFFHPPTPRATRLPWPSSYQRPPTHSAQV